LISASVTILWFPKIPSNWIRAVREYQHIIRNDGCDCSFAGFLGFPLGKRCPQGAVEQALRLIAAMAGSF
jgi:hypothetical protein